MTLITHEDVFSEMTRATLFSTLKAHANTPAVRDAVGLNVAAIASLYGANSQQAGAAGLVVFHELVGGDANAAARAFLGLAADWAAQGRSDRRGSYEALADAGIGEDDLPGYSKKVSHSQWWYEWLAAAALRRAAGAYATSHYVRVRYEEAYAMRGIRREWKPTLVSERQVLMDLRGLGLGAKEAQGMLPDIPVVDARRMQPGVLDELVESGNEIILNTYRPGIVAPAQGSHHDIDALLLNLVGGDLEGREFLKDWLASMIRPLVKENRAQKNRTAIVLVGDQGAGKDTLRRILTAILGDLNVKMVGNKVLGARFTDPYKDKLLVIFNEIEAREEDAKHFLKLLITDEIFPLEAKGKAEQTYPNWMNVMVFSNAEVPVEIEPTDRRYTVFFSGRLDPAIGTRLSADIEGPKSEIAAFFGHLLERDVKYKPGALYVTNIKDELKHASRRSEAKFIEEVKTLGLESLIEDYKDDIVKKNRYADAPKTFFVQHQDVSWLPSNVYYDVYRSWCVRYNYMPRGENALAAATARGIIGAEKKQIPVGRTRKMAWRGLPVDAAMCEEARVDPAASGGDVIDIEAWFNRTASC